MITKKMQNMTSEQRSEYMRSVRAKVVNLKSHFKDPAKAREAQIKSVKARKRNAKIKTQNSGRPS